MESVLLNHTWVIYCATRPSSDLNDRELQNFEKEATNYIQKSSLARKSVSAHSLKELDGCYATVDWIRKEQRELASERNEEAGRKRQRQSDDISAIHVQGYIAEEWCSEVLAIRDTKTVHHWICCVRGNLSYRSILKWLNGPLNFVVLNEPWKPTPQELAKLVGSILQHEISCGPSRNVPLSLTFQIPSDITKLDQILLTVPSSSFSKLCRAILRNKPKALDDKDTMVPVLAALNYFIKESFGIDTSSFALGKASCALCSISSDGRVKPLRTGSGDMPVMEEIFRTIRQREEKSRSKTSIDEDDLGDESSVRNAD